MEPTECRPSRVCFLSDCVKTVEGASERLAGAGIDVRAFRDIGSLAAEMGTPSETILALDTGVLSPEQDIPHLLSQIDGLVGGRPILVCVAHSNAIELRLQALRAGAEAYFTRPVEMEEFTARLLELSGAPSPERFRVLVVDDQPVAAVFAARVLQNAGMEVRIVGDSLQVLEHLEELRPDLVLMDLHMPGANGIEITTLIREHDELYDTPIVFLSSEMDTVRQMDALRGGGDDFIAKPVRPEQLVETVQQRIRTSRYKHGRHHDRLDRVVVKGFTSRSDFIKRVDAVISDEKHLAPGNGILAIGVEAQSDDRDSPGPAFHKLLERGAGAVRRYLGALEYATRNDAQRLLILASRKSEGALVKLSQTLQEELLGIADENAIRISIGIALFDPLADDALTMISRAENACALAQENGCGRIEIWSPLIAAKSIQRRDAQLGQLIAQALRGEGFHLMHQPIVALRRVSGERYATTLRLKSPSGDFVPAFDFLPVARREGLLPAIDRWVMEHALDELKQRQDSHRRLRFFVPQALETIEAAEWVPWFRDQILARDLIKQRPVLQFQLQDLKDHEDLAVTRFAELRSLAIKICLNLTEANPQVSDQIGRLGTSLVRLPLQTAALMDSKQLARFVTRMHELGARVIVSGIEQPHAIARAWSCGVDLIQGNFLQPPSEDLKFDFTESALL